MEDNFYQDDFEQFLKEQADSHRMFPSDQIWRNIHNEIHGDKRWPALTISAFILLISTVAVCVYFSPKPNLFAIQPVGQATSLQTVTAPKNNLSNGTLLTFNHPKVSPGVNTWTPNQNAVVTPKQTAKPTAAETVLTANSGTPPAPLVAAMNMAQSGNSAHSAGSVNKPSTSTQQIPETDNYPELITENIGESKPVTTPIVAQKLTKKAGIKDDDEKGAVDKFLKENRNDLALYTSAPKTKSTRNTFSYSFYITPSISYRKLKEDRSYLKQNSGGPVALNYVADVHQIVRHKPGNGLEAGAAVHYALSEKVKLTGGAQVNFRQYTIEAYRSGTEVAAIALVTSRGIDTINRLAFYRTTSGTYAAEIRNQYYQLSAPIGFEWQVMGNKAVQLNVAATLQPTYLLNQNAFVLSSNLKNYTESPELQKRWNLNTSIEANISFKVGDYNWKIGPQLRYQNMPTQIREYPIREYLMDYGLKLGVSKSIN